MKDLYKKRVRVELDIIYTHTNGINYIDHEVNRTLKCLGDDLDKRGSLVTENSPYRVDSVRTRTIDLGTVKYSHHQ